MSDWTNTLPPGLEAFDDMARAVRDALPAPYAARAREVALRVEDFASDEMLDALEMESPYDLTGLYEGIPLTEKSVMDQPHGPDVIWLFRRPILEEWADRGDIGLGALIAHVYVHELAHHMGWSDADIATIDRWWE
ncbi:metallopeptidase family protein [Alterinioella nitratireducens]|uniref:metallopeptidase family protein n=1 Tax=Alterinioella nitratireducens TaxID=2735915 RepID=UPI000C353A4B|nr:neutral zinc metallopeptidase [Nioella sp.]NPD19948.1 metallopeptidase family protein [Alterinioella nitratireducens]